MRPEISQMHRLIVERSKRITDPAERETNILEETAALEIARECGTSLRDVYCEALSSGIYPHRYLRNRDVITMEEQLKLARCKVAVVGAGGLGGQVILLLARVGIGQLTVVDHDVFDETNLNRQALCTKGALGKGKSEEAVSVTAAINPGVLVTSSQTRLDASNGPEILAGSDVIVDALDNVPDRLVLQGIAQSVGAPLVHGALAGFEGQLMSIFPEDPGLRLLYGTERVERKNPGSPEAVLGVPSITASMIATLEAMEVLKILLGRGKIFRHMMLHVDLENGRLSEFVFSPPSQDPA
jgi:molybdopterin/thiamine biosynthesis adenylyltransferase